MAAQKGKLLLMKIGNGASPEVFTTIGGMRSNTLTMNDGARTILAQGGVNSITIAGSGVFTDSASETTLKTSFNLAALINYQFLVPGFGTFTGAFMLTSLEYAGEYNGEVTYSFTFESAAAITFATV